MSKPVDAHPIVIITEPLTVEATTWLAERAEVVRAAPHEDAFARAAPTARALVVRTYTTVDAALLARLPRLAVVGRAGVGVDNIDLEACAARGVRVVSTPDANTQAVVEYVLCLLCDALRPRLALDGAVDAAEWHRLRDVELVAPRQMSEMTLGILGLGRIGRRVAAVARAIGFHVVFHDLLGILDEDRHGAEPVDLTTLFRQSDALTIHVDGRASNRHLVGAAWLREAKDELVLLNTSRGMVVDHAALARWLTAHPMATALLDVHDPEPITEGNPLLGLDNAFLFPHLASRTGTAMRNMSWVVREVVEMLQGSGVRDQGSVKDED